MTSLQSVLSQVPVSDCPTITLLAGGVGGAKAAEGLQASPYAEKAAIIANIGDDEIFHGLKVCPDIDTLIYSLSDQIDRNKGWGLKEESYQVLSGLKDLGCDTWMTLGDKDFATHIYRSMALNKGQTLTEVTEQLAARYKVTLPIMPPTDDPVPTQLYYAHQWHSFQDYFVREQCRPDIEDIRFSGAEQANATDKVLNQLSRSEIILLAPSNPLVSIGAILAVPDIREAIQDSNAFVVAISPFITGKTVKGPADRMMRAMGKDAGNIALAEHYSDLIHALVIDQQDQPDAQAIEATGIKVLSINTLMKTLQDKEKLIASTLHWATEQFKGELSKNEPITTPSAVASAQKEVAL